LSTLLYANRLNGNGAIAAGWTADGHAISTYLVDGSPRPTFVGGDQVVVSWTGKTSAGAQPSILAQCISVGVDSTTLGGYWRFEEGSGTTVVDASGNGNTAMLTGDAGFSPQVPVGAIPAIGANSYSLTLDGSDDAATILDSPTLRPRSAITVECWVRPTGPIGWVVVGKQLGSGCCANSFQIEIGSGAIHWNLSTDQATQAAVAAPDLLPRNAWSHIAGTWDGSEMRLFVNGQQVAEGALGGTLQYDANPVNIGADSDNPGGEPACCWFAGGIDEVRISGIARGPSEFLVADIRPGVADARRLRLDAFPNPSHAGTAIQWTHPERAEVGLAIYDAAGRQVRLLVRGALEAGSHRTVWDGRDGSGRELTAGVYFARLWLDGPEHTVTATTKVSLTR
jgi:hypothetical protein